MTEFDWDERDEPPEGEGHHGTGPVGVERGVGLVLVVGPVKVLEGVELGGGVVETAQFGEREDVEGEVGEVLVWLAEEREGARVRDLVEDGAPRTSGRQVLERAQVVGQVVQSAELVR